MSAALRYRHLLQVLGLLFFFTPLAFAWQALGLPMGSTVADLFLWEPTHTAYQAMIGAIYTVWGAFLLAAARDVERHDLFVLFTIVGNLAHVAVMAVLALTREGQLVHLVGDVLLLGVLSGVIAWARAAARSQAAGRGAITR